MINLVQEFVTKGREDEIYVLFPLTIIQYNKYSACWNAFQIIFF